LDTGKRKLRGEKPIPRDPGERLPCFKCPRCEGEEKRPNSNADLSERNWRAYQHYRECRAVGRFPDDPIVRQNASLIRMVEDAVERQEFRESIMMLGRMTRGR